MLLVAGALQDGKSADQMKTEKLLAEFDAWSWNFISSDRMIDTVVRDLSGE